MNKPVFLAGGPKLLFYLTMILDVFFRYFFQVLRLELCPLKFFRLIFRLVLFLNVLIRNKVVKIGSVYKLQLYLPAYPTPAFWESINKFVRPDPGLLTVVFSMTKACGYKCPHCYQRNDTGDDLDCFLLKKTARQMQEIGVTMFDIEGGEPLLKFDRLLDLLSAFDGKREVWVNTTGHTLSPEKARKMKESGVFGVMMSLHSPDPENYDRFTNFKNSFDIARNAARMFNEAGITVALNCCPSSEMVENGGVERIMQLAREWGCSYVQVIHEKPAGAWLERPDEMIRAPEKIRKLMDLHLRYNSPNCMANFPSASVQVFEESPGHFGCTAGGIDRFYLNANGEVQPCEFINVSFGNVREEEFPTIFNRMRSYFRRPGTRWLCSEEAHSIHRTLKKNRISSTPLPKHLTEKLVPKWKRGKKTGLYKFMNLYT